MERTALVTGGSSGIGLELVTALADEGVRVLACGTREKPPPALEGRAGVHYRSADLATEAGRADLVAWTCERAPALDWLFNNAGIQNECAIEPGLDDGALAREIAVNLAAPVALTAALVPALEAAKGCVVNLSSGLAYAPKASAPVYCATKAALSSFSRTLRWQLEPRGVRVVDVVTPLVRTPMTEGRHEGAMEPDAFVAGLLAALRSGRDEVWLGKARLLRLLLRVAPGRARGILRHA